MDLGTNDFLLISVLIGSMIRGIFPLKKNNGFRNEKGKIFRKCDIEITTVKFQNYSHKQLNAHLK